MEYGYSSSGFLGLVVLEMIKEVVVVIVFEK